MTTKTQLQNPTPKIYIAAEHCGIELKKYLLNELKNLGITDVYSIEDPNDDYPDTAQALAKVMQNDPNSFGIAICGSGQGICMAMNRFNFIRASMPRTIVEASKTREHNNSNVMCFGAEILTKEIITKIITEFVNSPTSKEERHERRVAKMCNLDFIKI
jgi:ribose 5-phosphate isomerase B